MTDKATQLTNGKLRLVLIGLYSEKYPAVGETHGLSVVAGALVDAFGSRIETICVVDLVAAGQENIDPVLSTIKSIQPNVVGISVPYGTFDILLELKNVIIRLLDEGKCVMLGGALPSYLGEEILKQIDDRLVIVVGEGELAAVLTVRKWMEGEPLDGVPNLQFKRNGKLQNGPRQLVSATDLPVPYRAHLPSITAAGAQVFIEASRACSWAECTFCLRGVTDIEGKSKEFRRLPITRLTTDLNQLAMQGVTAVTFADEDFLGGDVSEVEALVEQIKIIAKQTKFSLPHIDVSANIRSIFCNRDDRFTTTRKRNILRELAEIGLNKVFLGIESGSPSQLERYKKGHSVDECLAAARIVLSAGIRLEIGFIMFDPLCSLQEVSENVRFLLDGNLVEYVSSPTSELRLQPGSRYLKIVERFENKMGKQLYNRQLDLNTLSYSYNYADEDVGRLVEAVRKEKISAYDLTYRLKALTRFGDGLILGERTQPVQNILGCYRRDLLIALERGSKEGAIRYAETYHEVTVKLASGFLGLVDDAFSEIPLIARAVSAARNYLNADKASSYPRKG